MSDLEALIATLEAAANQVEKLAFDFPPPNSYTPQLVMCANAMREEARKARRAQELDQG